MAYTDYLKTYHWKTVKNKFYHRRLYRCYFCGKRRALLLHHISYENLGKEKIVDLVYLCSACHDYIHSDGGDNQKAREWLIKKRIRNLKLLNKFGEKLFLKKQKKINKGGIKFKKIFRAKWSKIKPQRTKNFAGLFTWKAKELNNE